LSELTFVTYARLLQTVLTILG